MDAIRVAKEHGIDVLIDAVMNVCSSYVTFEGTGSQSCSISWGQMVRRKSEPWRYTHKTEIVS